MKDFDDLDIYILRELENDARISYRKIAKKLNISVGTVHNRLSKLKKKKVIKEQEYLLNLDEKKLGFNLKFLILVTIDGKHTEEVLSQFLDYPEVTSIYHILGETSASIVCRFRKMEEVQEFIKRINNVPYVLKTTSNMVLNIYKEDEHHIINALQEIRKRDKEKNQSKV
ncbi:MAG: winged helix-turn-helix transcriptional regulator [Candidatus Lokiarchaeota archaeon]|nr:winged helix-turn-helix transcriptional regulator [Candidatus Lokiarchaeota archaeon]